MITNETLSQAKWREGKSFLFLVNESIASLGSSNIILDIGSTNDFILTSIEIEAADTESITWNAYVGSSYTAATGVNVTGLPRNARNARTLDTKVISEPDGITPGSSMLPSDRLLVSKNFSGNRFFIESNILGGAASDELFTLLKSNTYQLKINNTGAFTSNVEVSINGWIQ